MSRVLIVDDEQGIREVLSDILEDEGYQTFTAEDGMSAMQVLKTEPVDVVLLDVWLPNRGGIDVLSDIKEIYPETEVIIITGHATIDLAVKAVKLGAFDFLEKPLGMDRVTTIVRNADRLEQLRRENRSLKASLHPYDSIIGSSDAMKNVLAIVDQSAATDARILITGDNGTGKELVAREIHARSRRRDAPFVAVNCAAIPDTLLESELFGHEKGAFTGASHARRGKFETAHTGTIFLDEVADMSLTAQAKVLRVIQELRFERVGSEDSLHVDVRIVAATNKDLRAEVAAKRFREDLFFRLNVIPIQMPALKERLDDIPELSSYFLSRFAEKHSTERHFTPDAIEVLKAHPWPGNIRELKNLVERVTIMCDDVEITGDIVRGLIGAPVNDSGRHALTDFDGMTLNEARDEFERRLIRWKLSEHDNNISRTAEHLGLYPSNLHGKIRKLGIQVGA
ncbi:MAG: sigma-54-dependent transcriptional regulator [Spirochaetaceae bacterium]